MKLTDSVTEIKGIGDSRAKLLSKLGIFSATDLMEYFPREYSDRREIKSISELIPESVCTFKAKIKSRPENQFFSGKAVTKMLVYDDTGELSVVFYGRPYLKNQFEEKEEYLFTGLIREKYKKREIIAPEYEKISENYEVSGKIVPIYGLTKGLSQKQLRGLIEKCLEFAKGFNSEFLPFEVRKKYKLCEREFAIQNIHFPKDGESFFEARKRLVFEELFGIQAALFKIKKQAKRGKKSHSVFEVESEKKLREVLPFKLTSAQERVLTEIKKDITSGYTMNRLIQGDVGSGKTAVSMLAAFIIIKNGGQAALMAPTEVLAVQHYNTFCRYFNQTGIKTVLLKGAMSKKEKEEILRSVESGEANMIIGTHAVIQKDVRFKNLLLIITDEQHRFGVGQRGAFSEKGRDPHVLVMTATPIPRTLALILYGDLDISVIDELPPGREKIKTYSVDNSFRKRIYNFIKKEIEKGKQAYIVCPSINESEKGETVSVEDYAGEILGGYFDGIKSACLHGRLTASEKERIMSGFVSGEIKILVSTTVIEVGIDVPNATVILIENAERFGLSQMHQLRGRVGRGKDKSYCILMSDAETEIAKERLKIMCGTQDGFIISEEDLKLRGPGDFFGTRQHGLPELKIANLYEDIPILKEAQAAAEEVLNGCLVMRESEKEALDKRINGILSYSQVIL